MERLRGNRHRDIREYFEDDQESTLFPVTKGKVGYINKDGEIVIKPQFDSGTFFHEGLARIKIGDKWGYIDKAGEIAISPQFKSHKSRYNDLKTYPGVFSEGLASVGATGKMGYIDKTGRFVIKPQFDFVRGFSEGLAVVSIADKWGFIDKKEK
jgi:hypothetical protein